VFPIPRGAGPLLRLQVVVARPGDESFFCGSLLLHASCRGATTAVTCATRGEGGAVRPGMPVPAQGWGALREDELRTAASLLGVRRVRVLDLRESGTDRPAGPDTLGGADPVSVRQCVAADVAAFGADVLVTVDPADGHRDRALIRDVTLEVGAARRVPVYLVSLRRDPDGDAQCLDLHEHLSDRWAAIRAHRSQVSPFDELPEGLARELLAVVRLVRVPAPVPA
jgi:LmbE family N-acetylglucosaminyl deacetylase